MIFPAFPRNNRGRLSLFSCALILSSFSLAEPTHLAILCYHHLDLHTKIPTPYTTTSEKFAQQLDLIAKSGYSFVSLQQIEDYYTLHKALPAKSVAITFDDGNHDTYTRALPILKKRAIPFALFIYTSSIAAGHKLGFCNWDDVKDLDKQGVTIGSHSFFHPIMTLPPKTITTQAAYNAWLHSQIEGAKETIETHLGHPIRYFAVPFGAFDTYVYNKLKAGGFKLVLNVHGANNNSKSNPLDLNRVMVFSSDTAAQVLQKVSDLAIDIEDSSPKDLARINQENCPFRIVLNNNEGLVPSTIQLTLNGHPQVITLTGSKPITLSTTLTMKKESYYNVSLQGKDSSGQTYKHNWLIQYNKVAPLYLTSAT